MADDPKYGIKTENAENTLDILGESKWYMVPEFQRGYRWTQEQIGELFSDILLTEGSDNKKHFIGTFVIVENDSEGFMCEENRRKIIIDGQQRLATLSIMIAVIRDISAAFGWKTHPQLSTRLRAEVDEDTPCDRILLGEHDKELFQCILSDRNTTDLERITEYFNPETRCLREELRLLNLSAFKNYRNKHNRRLHKAYQIVLREIAKEMPRNMIDGKNWLRNFSKWLLHRVIGCQVKTYDTGMAYEVFESLNARGLGLTPSELLKNYLFSLAKKEGSLPQVRKNWQAMETNLPSDDASGFLRHWYMSSENYVAQKDLYRKIRSLTQSHGMKAVTLTKKLFEESSTYGKLKAPLGNFNPEIDNVLINIKDLGMNVLYPLLLSVFRVIRSKKLKLDITTFIEVLSFRAISICGGRGGELEKICSSWAIKIRKARTTKLANSELLKTKMDLIKLNPEESFFRSQFLEKEFTSGVGRARYLLSKIELHLCGGLGPSGSYTLNRDNVNIEHIFPLKPNTLAQKYMIKQGLDPNDKNIKGRIGNLTLLCQVYNSQASNKSFHEKMKDYYSIADTEITKVLFGGYGANPTYVKPADWNKTAINNRQEWLLDYAIEHGLWDLK